MKIILIRHFKVNYKWKLFYNSLGYEKACEGYDKAHVLNAGLSLKINYEIFASTMIRAIETTRLIFNKDPDFTEQSLCEVPMKPFMVASIRLPKFVWDIMGRVQWRLGNKRQPESYVQSKLRVNSFAHWCISQNKSCIVVCHGWIIKLMIKELKRIGFSGTQPIFIKTGIPYEFSI